jgi:hypothetical protein
MTIVVVAEAEDTAVATKLSVLYLENLLNRGMFSIGGFLRQAQSSFSGSEKKVGISSG